MATALVDIREQLRQELASIQTRVAPVFGRRISTKNKQFTLPDGRSTSDPIDLIILDWRIAHAYRTGVDNPNVYTTPDCWAKGTTTDLGPDPTKVSNPRSEFCSGCRFNEYKTAANGRGKACKELRVLAVIPVDHDVNDEPYILEASPTACRGFDKYVMLLKAKGFHPAQVLTTVSFDPAQTYPTLQFGVASSPILDDATLATAFKVRADFAAMTLDRDM